MTYNSQTMFGYATRQPLLALAVAQTDGPILELGCGHYSTPLLHALSGGRRRIVTLDHDAGWLEQFAALRTAWHELRVVADWPRALAELPPIAWSVCLVDQGPPESRGPSIAALRDRVRVFVCHDTTPDEWIAAHGYEVLAGFAFRRDDRSRMPGTTIVSDAIDVGDWPAV
jgi:hypothetical protein